MERGGTKERDGGGREDEEEGEVERMKRGGGGSSLRFRTSLLFRMLPCSSPVIRLGHKHRMEYRNTLSEHLPTFSSDMRVFLY